MSCCIGNKLSEEEKTIVYLVGPTKCLSAAEMRIYSHASLCRVREADKGIEISAEETTEKLLFTPMTTFPKPWQRQNYKQWKALMDLGWRLRQIKKHKIIYIQPLDEFPDFISEFSCGAHTGLFEFLCSLCEIFFMGINIKLLPALNMKEAGWNVTSRVHEKTNQEQYLVTDIQKNLKKNTPKDGYCTVGISWTDLYPREEMNFVLGDANAGLNSAVFCFGRFEPKKFKEGLPPPAVIDKIDENLIWRLMKVITHETCHILGMAHCEFFECAMNESTSMDQAMSQPLFLCPVCLRKLQKTAKFDIEQRYVKLLEFLVALGHTYEYPRIRESIDWLKRALGLMNTSEELVINNTHI